MSNIKHPIDNISWKLVDELTANEYNPNFVLTPEMNLLKHSLLTNGWIQPILISSEGVIIDGFHRHLLAKNDKDIRAMTEGLVPCAVLELTKPEAIMLTVRINRAKGVHSAVQMHKLVSQLINDMGLTVKEVCKGLGATKEEVDLLLKEDIFKRLDIENQSYTKAWGLERTDK